ncbi:MAG: CehA/McbA family metallohydrolase [Oscillochloris sp.]|nr:CehA/McbA family metallohydrolase [Oscillochloris sp.]
MESIILVEERGRVTPKPLVHYIQHEFDVPADTTAVTMTLRYRKRQLCQLFISLFAPDGFRGCHMQPGAQGEIMLQLRVASDSASRGGIAGPITPGRWRAQIDIERTAEESDYLLTIAIEQGGPAAPAAEPFPEDYVANPAPGWYRGELHAHSWESDGKAPVADVVAAARHYGLDFLALTDHFTISGFGELGRLVGPGLALIRSCELTGHAGHANIHGLRRWHDIYVDGREDWDINALARDVRAAGGLFCVNHPFSNSLGWRYHEFDWNLADMIEVYHHLEGINNLYQIGLWDEQLRAGRRIVGVAGIDSHHPHEQRHRLGQVFTAIYADSLSEAGIIAGLRRGKVYLTRGPELLLHAEGPDGSAEIGEEIAAGPLTITAQVGPVHFPFRLFLFKNGLFHDLVEQFTATSEPLAIGFEDPAARAGDYFRAELHAIFPNEENPWKRQRDHQSMLAMTNPIFVI